MKIVQILKQSNVFLLNQSATNKRAITLAIQNPASSCRAYVNQTKAFCLPNIVLSSHNHSLFLEKQDVSNFVERLTCSWRIITSTCSSISGSYNPILRG